MLYNETNNFDEIKTLFPDKTEIEVVIRPCLPRADHRVPGGLILRKLMVCFSIIRFFPVLTKLQEAFGGCDVFTATRWWEEANQAAAPGRRPTLEWQATWGQSTREKLFRWWFQPFFGNSSKLYSFQVQRRLHSTKEGPLVQYQKDVTVRGSLPLFCLCIRFHK